MADANRGSDKQSRMTFVTKLWSRFSTTQNLFVAWQHLAPITIVIHVDARRNLNEREALPAMQ